MINILNFLSKKEVYGTLIILVVTYILYKIFTLLINNIVVKGKDELEKKKRLTVIHLFKNILKYVLMIFMILFLLNLYGINTSSLITGIGVAGIVIGLGLQEVLKDVFNGIGIIFNNYYIIGDIVNYDGFIGTVVELGLKSTKIKNINGEVLSISNRNIDKIINLSQHRSTVTISIPTAYEEKFENVKKVLADTIEDIKNNNKDVHTVEFLGIESFESSSIIYQVRFRCTRGMQWDLRREFLKEIKIAYEKNKIKIPYNQVEVHNGTKI